MPFKHNVTTEPNSVLLIFINTLSGTRTTAHFVNIYLRIYNYKKKYIFECKIAKWFHIKMKINIAGRRGGEQNIHLTWNARLR